MEVLIKRILIDFICFIKFGGLASSLFVKSLIEILDVLKHSVIDIYIINHTLFSECIESCIRRPYRSC